MPFPENTPLPDPTPAWRRAEADPLVRGYPPGFRRAERRPWPPAARYALHLGLFLLTVLTTTLAGVTLTRGDVGLPALDVLALRGAALWAALRPGLLYALPFLGVLTVHEFGHYLVARRNRVAATLPYFLPMPLGLGTFGAVIRIRDRIFSRQAYFDIGLAGPLAGFVVAVPLLAYGFYSLPPLDYLFGIHPTYAPFGADYARHVYPPGAAGITLARPLLYQLLEEIFANPDRLPHPNELLHYPLLVAGSLSLFFTALNLLPIGQLDGGHILYGLLGGRRFNGLARWLFVGFIFYAGLGLFSLKTDAQTWLYFGLPYAGYLALVMGRVWARWQAGLLLAAAVWAAQLAVATAWPAATGNPGWLLFGLLLSRVTGIYHPPAPNEAPLGAGRQVLGWVMVAIFVLCFSPSPFAL